MPEWQLVSTSLASENLTLFEGLGLRLRRRLNGGNTLTFAMEAQDTRISDILIGECGIKAYRGATLRFHGRVWEPTTFGPDLVTFVCEDPWAHVENRRVATADGLPLVYTATDAGAIAWNLILLAKTEPVTSLSTPVRIRQGTTAASIARDRTYEVGKPIGEAIRELANVQNGFYFRVDPVDSVAGTQAEIVFLYPTSGTTQTNVRLQFGADTLSNIADYEIVQTLPRNQVRARGSSSDSSIITTVRDIASIAKYDMFEDDVSFSNVSVAATLSQNANEMLEGSAVETIKIVPAPNGPMLWDDFDVGDTLLYYISHGALTRIGSLLITEVEVTVTDGGFEHITSLIGQTV